MRKSHIDSILVEQALRRRFIISLLCFIALTSIFVFSLFFTYFKNKEENYVTYDEKSDISYKVYLKENEFFESNYLESNNQYIANLINNITANFQYELLFDKDVGIEYQYSYKVDANVNVYDKDTNNVLFSKTENLLPSREYMTSQKQVKINEFINIDYNYFNDLINKFVNTYDLEDAESVLTIDMQITTSDSCDSYMSNNINTSTMSLSIPLTTKTVAIEVSNDLIETENNIMLCEVDEKNYIILVFAMLFSLLDLIIIIYLIKYEIKTRTAETIYLKKLKKILNNYGAYIQEIADDFNVRGYQLIKIMTFEDLLEIRDTIKQPILMKQNKEKNSAYFMIPSNSKQVYIYRLKVEKIEKIN